MKNKLIIEITLCAAIAGLLWAAAYAADDAPVAADAAWSKQQGFVAHEWGAQVEDSRNPYDMAADLKDTPADDGRGVAAPMVMERAKPVLYFYTAERKTVQVTVSAREGVLKYYYPPAVLHEVFGAEGGAQLAGYSRFVWPELTVLPVGETSEFEMAAVPKKHWWHSCRAVECSPVELNSAVLEEHTGMRDAEGAQVYAERFLFYDGSSSRAAQVPFALKEGAVGVTNNEQYALQHVFVLHRNAEGCAWGYAAVVQPGKEAAVKLSGNEGEFAAAFAQAQLEAGLYAGEVASFWAAWEQQFFLNEGTRVLYLLPQAVMDEVMPLAIEPKPDSTVRVNWVCLGK